MVAADKLLIPALDDCFALTSEGAVAMDDRPKPRIAPEKVGHADWHNDLSRLILSINAAIEGSQSEQERAALLQRLNAVLNGGDTG